MSARLDDDVEFLDDDVFPDRLKRGRDGMDLSRLEPGGGWVYTGLGGEGERLRYIVIAAVIDGPLAADAQPDLEAHWREAARAHHAKLEELTVAPEYVQVTLLISMDVAPDDVVRAGLRWRSEGKQRLNPEYYITNCGVPTEEEIAFVLAKINE